MQEEQRGVMFGNRIEKEALSTQRERHIRVLCVRIATPHHKTGSHICYKGCRLRNNSERSILRDEPRI